MFVNSINILSGADRITLSIKYTIANFWAVVGRIVLGRYN